MPMVSKTYRLDPELAAELDRDARAEGVDASTLVRHRLRARRPLPPAEVRASVEALRKRLARIDDDVADALDELDQLQDAVGEPLPDGSEPEAPRRR